MKRIALISIAALAVLAGCTKFEHDQEYDLGATTAPTVSVKVVDDNTVNISVAGAKGNGYYSYALIAGETEEINPATLLADGYSDIAEASACCNFKDTPSVSADVTGLDPNTVYTLYAVAANENGVLSELVTKEITTTDETEPDFAGYDSEIDDEGIMWIYVKFDDPVELTGNGQAHLSFYAPYSPADGDGMLVPMKIVDVPAADLILDGQWLCVAVPEEEAQPGAVVVLTYDEGIVKNALGETNPAFDYAVVPADIEEIDALYEVYDTEAWDLIPKYLDLAGGAGITEWTEGHIEKFSNYMQLMILVGCDCMQVAGYDGTAELTYVTPDGKRISQDIQPANVMGDLITFRLPDDPGTGSIVNYTIPEEMFVDIWGNPNAELVFEGNYLCSFGYTPEDFYGTFVLTTTSYFQEIEINDSIEIAAADYDPADYEEDPEYDFMITGSFMGVPIDYPIYGWFDCDAGTITMENEQPFFYQFDEENQMWYEFCLLDYDNQEDFFTISHPNKNTYTTTDWMSVLLYMYDAEWEYLDYDFYDLAVSFSATRAGSVPSIIITDEKAPVAKHNRPVIDHKEFKRK